MRTIQNTTRWLGLALACGIITFAVSAQAGKPVKPPSPPPEPPPPAGPAYWIIPVEDVHLPAGISDSGTLFGAGGEPTTGLPAPCLLTPRIVEGEVQYLSEDVQWLLDADGNLGWGEALAVNQAGLVVGYIGIYDRAMLWLPDGTAYDLGVAPANENAHATAINNSGLVAVGNPGEHNAGVVVPLYDEDGTPSCWFVDVNPKDGINDLIYPIETGSSLTPVAINEAGQVALKEGYLLTPESSNDDKDGNLWYADDDPVDGVNDLLVALEGPDADVVVADLNSAGQVVGRSGRNVMLWELVDGKPVVTDLGSVSRGLVMHPKGINESGRIVGTSTKVKGPLGPAWLIENGILYELLPLVVNPEGWEALRPYGINSLGWICGIGDRVEGGLKRFVAIPVEQP